MDTLTSTLNSDEPVSKRTAILFQEHLDTDRKQTDRMFAWLMVIQWLAGISAAVWISPRAWDGIYSHTHVHVWAALFLGGIISGFPVFLALTRPGAVLTRHVIAVGQMLSCGLLIHLTGGRIESHFQYFGALAFIAFYSDLRVLLTATAVAAADHFIRGMYWPQSIFGVLAASWWRWLEHAGWIAFEDIFLALAIRQNLRELVGLAGRQAKLEELNETIERKVDERTSELRKEIADRKRAEESLSLLSSAVKQSTESIMITDAQLNLPGPTILFVNPAFTRMTGYTAEEAIGRTPRILQGPRTDKAVLKQLRQNLRAGETFAGETVNYRKDGKEFHLEWQIAPICNGNGETTHFVAIQRDTTARKRIEAQLIQSQKMETVGKLAGGIAHEFNSILTAIIGQSEMLLENLPDRSPLANNVLEINQAAARAATLTRQLLAYARKQFLQPETLDLNRVIAGMEGVFRLLMGGDVDTQVVPGPALHAVKADAGQIELVIMNIVINARDAMPKGGKLTLETANVSFEADSVGRYPELKPGDYVLLAITDTGAGMTEEVKARLFEPFFSTKAVGQGTGLGLSTCYGIVKQSGGHISVYSEPGRGATFKIYLPQVHEQARIPVRPLESQELPRGTETILLVEDDPALREMASTLLRRLGYTVWVAANGIEALSLKQQRNVGHVDLLFTDIVMPHMSGKELADRVEALYPHTRILFTSAYTESAIVHQGALNKGVALLQKPFTPSALANKLREVLGSVTTSGN